VKRDTKLLGDGVHIRNFRAKDMDFVTA